MAVIRQFFSSRYFLWLLLAVPSCYLCTGFIRGTLFYGEVLHATGELSARLILVALAATPLRLSFPQRRLPQWLAANRRYFGVASFAYALLHTAVYLNKQETMAAVIQDGLIFEMWTAWLSLVLLLLLAVTSNDRSVRWLKAGWKKLHRWVYVAAILAFVHWIFIAFNFIPGLIHLLILVALESVRVIKSRKGSTA
jgi:sulfoxide reductase heme-binding subunit YedZ